ncbi:cytochrome oxidase putative small subunit CydP [Pseudoduganella sp. OTU4001]|uniref:cytochrome oxidase putative small subunit CydP n=1 Tax=Pseudoduganella sp. OTU4001 TaxID=3043854 RepID=UPI00313B88FF
MKIPSRRSLALSIAIALAVKVLILFGLKTAFFSQPQTKKMRMPTALVERQLLATPLPVPTPTEKVKDGTRR